MISTRVLAGTQVFVAQAQFVDRSDGYVFAEGSPGVGMLPRPVLYRTQDGGATWRLLSTDFPSSDSTVQMRFISRRDGWIVAVNGGVLKVVELGDARFRGLASSHGL
jgi:photosystem II stability/assembly factor-like uncharacterized protein